ncbi:MAG: bifunctional riboflavin kinase/FAD synthetase [Candidatus Goldiibacteriota bacterium]
MKVYTSLRTLPAQKKKTAVTIGVFDGFHVGHRKLLESAIKCAGAMGGKSVVVTFTGHPEKHLKKEADIRLIKSTTARIKRIKSHGIDMLLLLDFKSVSLMTAEEFVKKVLVKKLNAGCISEGRDFRFGRGGAGGIALLKKSAKKYGFCLDVVPDVKIGNKRVSSTLIREALKKGDIKKVEKMLGRQYSITGRVEHGRHVGFDFPTANLSLDYEDIPAGGVWAVKVIHKSGVYTGAANIGFAPTLKKEKKQLLEVYILDFSGDIYGDEIKVVFLERLRGEKKFRTKEELSRRVKKDILFIRKKYGNKTATGAQ